MSSGKGEVSPLTNGNISPLTPLSIRSRSPLPDNADQLKAFLEERYNRQFKCVDEDELDNDTYRQMKGYTHIFEVNIDTIRFIIKLSSDPLYKSLIQHEWEIYKKLYSFDDYTSHKQYFLEGVEGGEYDESAYIILPYLPSTSLHDSLPELSNEKLFTRLRSVIDGLDYLLSHDICHGDMHSGNILLTRDSAKIIDFDKAGGCNETMNVGYRTFKNRKALRKNINFIGISYDTFTGFFLMCKDILTKKSIPTTKLDEIMETYIGSSTSQQDIHAAYASARGMFNGFTLRGGRRKTRRKVRRNRKTLHLHATSK